MKTASLVGSTGSIGTQAADVVRAEPDPYVGCPPPPNPCRVYL
ncbi:MAG: hypothetical protein ACRD2W_00270 [Acidimicrobiales bacterium]